VDRTVSRRWTSTACLSRVLGNGHALVLRGARHSNVPGLPVQVSDVSVPIDALASMTVQQGARIEGNWVADYPNHAKAAIKLCRI
jgi:hypothetical protein